MVLEAIEDEKRGYPDGKKLAMGPIARGIGTIEHLMPQKWRKHWPADLTEDQESVRDRVVQQLGNLTLVTQELNSKLSNGPWTTKRDHFLQYDDVLLTKDALNPGDTWDELSIEQRTDQLVEQILNLWPTPAGHVGLIGGSGLAPAAVSVDVAQLVATGWLEPGTRLRCRYPGSQHADALALVAQDGRLYVGDVAFQTPSGAASSITGKTANGWWWWVIEGTQTSLQDIRENYVASLGEADAEIADDEPSGSTGQLTLVVYDDDRAE
jgi:hypothetical protein